MTDNAIRLWADVPADERIDDDFLLTRGGAGDPRWLERHRRRMSEVDCLAAVRWPNEHVWHPCGMTPKPGERFCFIHGGSRLTFMDKTIAKAEASILKLTDRIEKTLLDVEDMHRDLASQVETLKRLKQ